MFTNCELLSRTANNCLRFVGVVLVAFVHSMQHEFNNTTPNNNNSSNNDFEQQQQPFTIEQVEKFFGSLRVFVQFGMPLFFFISGAAFVSKCVCCAQQKLLEQQHHQTNWFWKTVFAVTTVKVLHLLGGVVVGVVLVHTPMWCLLQESKRLKQLRNLNEHSSQPESFLQCYPNVLWRTCLDPSTIEWLWFLPALSVITVYNSTFVYFWISILNSPPILKTVLLKTILCATLMLTLRFISEPAFVIVIVDVMFQIFQLALLDFLFRQRKQQQNHTLAALPEYTSSSFPNIPHNSNHNYHATLFLLPLCLLSLLLGVIESNLLNFLAPSSHTFHPIRATVSQLMIYGTFFRQGIVDQYSMRSIVIPLLMEHISNFPAMIPIVCCVLWLLFAVCLPVGSSHIGHNRFSVPLYTDPFTSCLHLIGGWLWVYLFINFAVLNVPLVERNNNNNNNNDTNNNNNNNDTNNNNNNNQRVETSANVALDGIREFSMVLYLCHPLAKIMAGNVLEHSGFGFELRVILNFLFVIASCYFMFRIIWKLKPAIFGVRNHKQQ